MLYILILIKMSNPKMPEMPEFPGDPQTKEDLNILEKEVKVPSFWWIKLEYDLPYKTDKSLRLTATKWVVHHPDSLVVLPSGIMKNERHKETYYSQKKLPWNWLKIPGRHVAEDGTVRDWDGYIVVAAPLKIYPKGTKIMTTLWPGKVYDTWWMTWKWIDIYTNW